MIKTRTNTKGKLMDYNNGQNNWPPNVPPMQGQPNPNMQGQQVPPQVPPQYPNQDPRYQEYLQYEQAREKKANTLCIISLILGVAGVFVIPAISAISGTLFNVDPTSSEAMQELVRTANLIPSFSSGLCTLAALVLMIIARVNYPTNKFAKVLMWIYIVVIAIYVILVITAIVACVWLLNQCIP